MNAKKNEVIDPASYAKFLEILKRDILESQLRAAMSITKEVIGLYWRVGRMIAQKVALESWGSKTIGRVSRDITSLFPGVTCFSYRNLHFMRQFAESYPNGIEGSAVSMIPWGHNIILMQKLETQAERLWYAAQTIEKGWSRSVLTMSIESSLLQRQGRAVTNFKNTLPQPQSDLAVQMMKDPFNLSFIELEKDFREHELEQGLTDHIQKFLLELGQGFAFVGRQVSLVVDGKEYHVDLLFYHLNLNRYVVIELKAKGFEPKDIGQLNFYMSAVDDLLRKPDDKPTIGMVFCRTKRNVTVEYALRDFNKPVGVAGYEVTIVESLSRELRENLPTVEEIEAEFKKEDSIGEKSELNCETAVSQL